MISQSQSLHILILESTKSLHGDIVGVVVVQSLKLFLTLCNPMDCSMPGIPVLHYLPDFAHTHDHRVSDAIQPSHPLSPPPSPALNVS